MINEFGSSKMRVVLKWKSEILFIFESIHIIKVINSKVNNLLFSQFVTTFILKNANSKIFYTQNKKLQTHAFIPSQNWT